MDIEAFLYLFLFETLQSEKIAENNQTILLPIAPYKLRVSEVRCSFENEIENLDNSIRDRKLIYSTIESSLNNPQ